MKTVINNTIIELEKQFTNNLQNISLLMNRIEQQEIDKLDMLKNIALDIIDSLDSFERIEESLIEKDLSKNEDVYKTAKRYSTIQKKLLILLNKYGIKKINFPDSKLIVGLCEIVETEADPNKHNDEIITIVKNGYIMDKQLIRAAQLIVVKN